MAGHNKWSKIKHRKARVDKKRSKIWSTIARDIIVATRIGGPDPSANLRLSYAILEAKKANMPADTVSRAIKRGTGELGGADPEEITYEGYAPGGAALLVLALSDNRNRTAGNVRHILEKNGGKLGTSGSVGYLFETIGKITLLPSAMPEDALMELAIEAGADDVDTSDDSLYEIICQQSALEGLKQALRDKGVAWESAERTHRPTVTNMLDAETARKVIKLVELLEDDEDVQSVVGNFELPDEVIAELSDE